MPQIGKRLLNIYESASTVQSDFTVENNMSAYEIFSLSKVSIFIPSTSLNSREDGGHLTIEPHRVFVDRTLATALEAVELMIATMLAGDSLLNVIGVENVNYQDMGNWSINKQGAKLHIHAFGRHAHQTFQVRGESISFFPQGHPIYTEKYTNFNDDEINRIERRMAMMKTSESIRKLLEIASSLS